jgi:hypothetical protein
MKKMNKKFAIILFFITLITFNCNTASQQPIGSSLNAKATISEGWVDENTFRIVALGAPKELLKSKVKRRITSKEAAVIMAQKIIVERFKGSTISGETTTSDGETINMLSKKSFIGVVRGGYVVQESFDEEDNCEIIYEIQSKGLKARTGAGIR